MNDLFVRRASPADADKMIAIHARSIRELCAADYQEEQIEAWIGNRTTKSYVARIVTRPTFVALMNGRLAGYAIYNPESKELQSIFVDPDFARRGVATALMAELIANARSEGLEVIWLDASLTAVKFYESVGFVQGIDTVHFFDGTPLKCVRMKMSLTD